MIPLDIIVGYYLPSIMGWVFLFLVLIAESILLSKYLIKFTFNKKIYFSAIVSNLITTIIGYVILDHENNGGHLLNWIPIDHYHENIRLDRTLFIFIISFIGTVIIETLINLIVLKQINNKKKIIYGTLLVNALTYLLGGFVILLYTIISNN